MKLKFPIGAISLLFQHPLYFPKNGKGLNEIDMITVNAFEHTVNIIKKKRNQEHIDWALLKVKGDFLSNSRELKGYTVTYKGLSLQDM